MTDKKVLLNKLTLDILINTEHRSWLPFFFLNLFFLIINLIYLIKMVLN